MRRTLNIAVLGSAVIAVAAASAGVSGAAPPRSTTSQVTIAAGASRVVFGATTVISGTVTSQKAAGTQVTVQQSPAPFTAPFTPAADPVAADAAGAYSVTVSPTVNTRYQATAKTKPPVTSPTVQVNVAPAVALAVSDTRVRRGRRVRFSGEVRPAHNGAYAAIQRRTSTGAWRTVARALLGAAADPAVSVYAKRLRMRRSGTYRVRLKADADHVAGRSAARRVRVG